MRALGVSHFKQGDLEIRLSTTTNPQSVVAPSNADQMPPDNEMMFYSVEPLEFINREEERNVSHGPQS